MSASPNSTTATNMNADEGDRRRNQSFQMHRISMGSSHNSMSKPFLILRSIRLVSSHTRVRQAQVPLHYPSLTSFNAPIDEVTFFTARL